MTYSGVKCLHSMKWQAGLIQHSHATYHNIHTSLRIQMYLENIKLLLTNGINMYRIILESISNNAESEGHLQGWNNIRLMELKNWWTGKKTCSTENRDFTHTCHTKIHRFISNHNEVRPLHKHCDYGSSKNLISNLRYSGIIAPVAAFSFCLPSPIGHLRSATQQFNKSWSQKSDATSKDHKI